MECRTVMHVPASQPTERVHPAARRRGASAVQFALVAPMFFTLILGAVEVGRGIMVTNQLTSAARNACRTAVIEVKVDSDVTSQVTTFLSAQGVTTTNVSTTIKVNGTVAALSTAQPNDQVSIRVTIPVSDVTWVPITHFLTGSLGGEWTLRRE
jgi:Flp pilus assembly protein TadG